jgi:hypothetical protein
VGGSAGASLGEGSSMRLRSAGRDRARGAAGCGEGISGWH